MKRKLEKGYITEEEAETQFIHNPPSSSSKVEEPAPKATAVADTSFTNELLSKSSETGWWGYAKREEFVISSYYIIFHLISNS